MFSCLRRSDRHVRDGMSHVCACTYVSVWDLSNRSAILFKEFCTEFSCRPDFSLFHLIQTLTKLRLCFPDYFSIHSCAIQLVRGRTCLDNLRIADFNTVKSKSWQEIILCSGLTGMIFQSWSLAAVAVELNVSLNGWK